MLQSEAARAERLFDWIAATAINPSAHPLSLVYDAGVIVTTFLPDDRQSGADARVYARRAGSGRQSPPLLFAWAGVVNAVSFVL